MAKILLLFILSLSASAEVVVQLQQDTPSHRLPRVQDLPPAPMQEAYRFNNEEIPTSLGTIILNGGYVGEGNYDYNLQVSFRCKNGRHFQVFRMKFCDFKNPESVKANFQVDTKKSKLRFQHLTTKRLNTQGTTSCTGDKTREFTLLCNRGR